MVPLLLLPRNRNKKMFLILSTLTFLVSSSSHSFVEAYKSPCLSDSDDRLYPDPEDCGKFYHCNYGIPISHDCPAGLHFDTMINACNWPSSAECTPTPSTSPPTKPTTTDPGESETTTTTTKTTTTTETPVEPEKKLLIGYFNNWASYRPGEGSYSPDNIDPSLFTHIVYAFAVLDEFTYKLKPFDDFKDIQSGYYDKVANQMGDTKALLGVGGWTDSEVNGTESKYSTMANDPEKRDKFVQSALEMCLYYGFDGLDLDWEYPGAPWAVPEDGNPEDKNGFTSLVQELKAAFEAHGLMLTAAVSGNPAICNIAYDVPNIVPYLDWIGVMTYDYHGHWDNVTGFDSPLYSTDENELSCDMSVNWWLNEGCPASKLILGIPIYARTFTLEDPSQCPLTGVPSTGPGRAGPYTKEPGVLAYYEICDLKDMAKPIFYPSTEYSSACLCYLDQVAYYNDEFLVARKAEYVNQRELGGCMAWDMTMDLYAKKWEDRGRKYELLTTIKKQFY